MPASSDFLAWIVLLPLLGAIFNALIGRKAGNKVVTTVGVGVVVASFALALATFFQLQHQIAASPGDPVVAVDLWSWIWSGDLSVNFGFMMDPLSAVMTLVVTGVGSLIHLFSVGYMRKDPAYWRYFSYLNLFMFAMLLLVLGKNLLVLFVGWEGVGLCSYLLIGFWYDDMAKARAGKKAFITNRVGDFAFLIATFILLYFTGGDLDFLSLEAATAEIPAGMIDLICLLLFVGACGKSAQLPLHVWLPDAMAGPTPVSALIHAATMVTAGVYMMCRMNFLYSASDWALDVVAWVGGATAFVAATIAIVQHDIKKVLAYSTVSQLGFMVMAVGVGAYTAAVFHLMTHAFFKACLFLGSGSVIHALHHEQDIRNMGGLKEKLPYTRWTFLVSCLAIAGVPFFSGFFSKDEILFNVATATHHGGAPQTALFVLGAIAALMTAFYMFRLYFLTFEGSYRGDKHTWDHAHEEHVMSGPLLILGFLATVGGFLGIPHIFGHAPHLLGDWLAPVFSSAPEHFHYSHDASVEWLLMGVSVAIGLAGIFAAHLFYRKRSLRAADGSFRDPFHPLLGPIKPLFDNLWYFDRVYAVFPVGFVKWVARFCYRVVDVKIIDGLFVRGPAKVVGWVGYELRQLQTGDVQAYLTALMVGLAVVIGIFLTV